MSAIKRTHAYDRLIKPYRERSRFRQLAASDRKMMKFYSQFVRPGDLVFDVGANRGNRSKIFLALGATVVAFEPQSQCVDYLEMVTDGRRDFRLVRKAVGAVEGSAEMLMSDVDVLSSLSPGWVEATSATGRFGDATWTRREMVPVTTLDRAMQEFGVPRFAKIDVEGFELEVFLGMSKPIPALSFEFTPEYLENAIRCIDRLSSLGTIEGQISRGESMEFALPGWQPQDELKKSLSAVDRDFGDIYVRFTGQTAA
jgi:FkbM family methyltransferase